MKKLFSILCVLLFVACQETTINPEALGDVSGVVMNDDGEPLGSAQIETNPATSIFLTDSAGQFLLKNLAVGEYTITARKPNYRNQTAKITVQQGQTAQVVLSLEGKTPTSSLRGTLLDAITNAPVVGASVTTNPPTAALLTDTAGGFVIDSLAAGDYSILVKKIGYQKDSVRVAVQAGKATPVAMLLNPAELTFNVPVQPQPSVAAREQPSELTLRWSIDQLRSEAELRYEVLLYTTNDPAPRTLAQNLAETSLEVTGLVPDRTYLWQVIVRDEQGHRTVGDVWTFQTKGS